MSTIVVDKNQPSRVIVVLQTGPQGPAGAAVGAVGTGFLHYTANIVDGARAVNPATSGDMVVGGANTVLTSNGAVGVWATLVDANIAAAAAIAVSKLAAGTNGQFLSVTAGVPTWVASPSSPPGGLNTQVQWNNAGAFGGVTNLTTDGTNVTKLQVSADPTWVKAAQVGTLAWTPTAARTLTLPDATDTVVARATTDTLTNKTISDDLNTINDSVTNAAGDLLKNNATKYVRFARGAASTILGVNSGGTDLVYAQIADANIAGSAAIATSKIVTPGASTQVLWNNAGAWGADNGLLYNGAGTLTLTTALQTGGGTYGTAGAIRFANNTIAATARNAGNTANIGLFGTDVSNAAYYGSDNLATGSFASNTWVSSSGHVYLAVNGSALVDVTTGTVQFPTGSVGLLAGGSASYGGGAGVLYLHNASTVPTSNPATGVILYSDSGTNTHLYARDQNGVVIDTQHGQTTIATEVGGTLSTQQFASQIIKRTGTAAVTLTMPGPSNDAFGCYRIIVNASSQNSITIANTTGAGTVIILASKTAIVRFDSGGAFRVTPDT